MKRIMIGTVAALAMALGLSACQSKHESGVTSNYRSQWTDVSADVQSTTRAAEAVLNQQQLRDVSSNATAVDGSATGKKADGTNVKVAVRKQGSNKSQVSVTVGTMGDPELGADIARRIKDRAEMGTGAGTGTTTGNTSISR